MLVLVYALVGCGSVEDGNHSDADGDVDSDSDVDVDSDVDADADTDTEACVGEADGAPCDYGLCHARVCDGASCFIDGGWYPLDQVDPSGCRACDPATPSSWSPREDGTPCAADGTCKQGECCEGCWNTDFGGGWACEAGDQRTACGAHGDACAACPAGCEDAAAACGGSLSQVTISTCEAFACVTEQHCCGAGMACNEGACGN